MSPLETNLRETLSMTNEWLRYAEAKNGALMAVNGALIFGVTQLQTNHGPWECVRIASAALLITAMSIGALSLMPWLARPGLFPTRPSSDEDNLLYFGDASRYDAETYLLRLSSAMQISTAGDRVTHWLANQVVINSRIAFRKFLLFNLALYFAASGTGGLASLIIAGFQAK